jgi:hypothetical protein
MADFERRWSKKFLPQPYEPRLTELTKLSGPCVCPVAAGPAGVGPDYPVCSSCNYTWRCKDCGGCRQCAAPGRKVRAGYVGDGQLPPLDRPPSTETELRRLIDYLDDPVAFARWFEALMHKADPAEKEATWCFSMGIQE